MRKRIIISLLFSCICLPGFSSAQNLDLEIWRLGNPRPIKLADNTTVPTDPLANQRFTMLMVDLGLAMHPTPSHPANSTGRAGMAMELGLRIPEIHPNARLPGDTCPPQNSNCRIWVTQGNSPSRKTEIHPPSRLIIPALEVRKGLPFSFELSSNAQYLVGSSSFALGGGLRWVINEGFDFLPDLSIGANAVRLIGTRDFGLTTGSMDIIAGKWFAIAGAFTITPYAGWQRVWVSALSAVIDFDPTDELPTDPTRDDTLFADVDFFENSYDRFIFGLRFKSYIAHVIFEGAYQPEYLNMSSTFNMAFKLGLDF